MDSSPVCAFLHEFMGERVGGGGFEMLHLSRTGGMYDAGHRQAAGHFGGERSALHPSACAGHPAAVVGVSRAATVLLPTAGSGPRHSYILKAGWRGGGDLGM